MDTCKCIYVYIYIDISAMLLYIYATYHIYVIFSIYYLFMYHIYNVKNYIIKMYIHATHYFLCGGLHVMIGLYVSKSLFDLCSTCWTIFSNN